MQNESSQRRAEIQAGLQLLEAASDGKLDGLPCPKCANTTVSVYFTTPTPGAYHTWFVCQRCDYYMRAQNSEKPVYYSPARDRTGKLPTPVVDPAAVDYGAVAPEKG